MPAAAARTWTRTATGAPHASATISLLRWLSQKRGAASGRTAIESSSATKGRTLQVGSASDATASSIDSARGLEDDAAVLAPPLEDDRAEPLLRRHQREGEVGEGLARFGEVDRDRLGLALDEQRELERARLVHGDADAPAPGFDAATRDREDARRLQLSLQAQP